MGWTNYGDNTTGIIDQVIVISRQLYDKGNIDPLEQMVHQVPTWPKLGFVSGSISPRSSACRLATETRIGHWAPLLH